MNQSINYKVGVDNSDFVSGMRDAQRSVRELSAASRSKNLGSLSGELQLSSGSMSTFTSGANRARGSLLEFFKTAGGGGSAMGGVTAAAGGAGGALAAFTIVTKAATANLESYAAFDSMVRGLRTLEGTADDTTKRIEKLRDVAKVPGLGFEEAVQADIRLRSVGISATESEATLRAFGNALATVGGGKADLDGVVLGLSQIAAKGKVAAEEINQIAERVPQVRAAMKAAFGSADSEVLQAKGLSATDFITGLTAELAKLPAVTGGAQNTLDNYTDSWKALKVEASEFMVGLSTTWLNGASSVMNQARRDVEALQELMGMKAPGLQGKDGKTEKTRLAEQEAEKIAAIEKAAAKARIEADNANAQASEERQQAARAWADEEKKRIAEVQEAREKQSRAAIAAAREQAFAAQLPPEDNLKRQIAEKKAEGPSGEDAVKSATVYNMEEIMVRTAAIMAMERELKNLREGAAAQALSEAEAAERKAEAEAKTLAARQQAAATSAIEEKILEAHAAGNKKKVAALERQLAVEEVKQRLMSEQGLTEPIAARAAERRIALEEAAAKRDANPRRSRLLNAEDSKAAREERMSPADKARQARWQATDAAAKFVGPPAPRKDTTEQVVKKLDKLDVITAQLESLGLAK